MNLSGIRRGSSTGDHPSLTFIHGFTQTSRSWDPVVDDLSRDHECVCLDAPGHGDSPDGSRSLVQCGTDIVESSPRGALIGYSMGARMALHAVLQQPRHFTALALISGTPGIEDEMERRERRASDEALARRIESIGVESFVDEWLGNPMFAGLSATMAMREDRLRNRASGLADSLRNAGTGTQSPLWERLAEITVPVLVVTGSLDAKFEAIGRRMADLIPHSTLVSFDGVGHTVHLESPRRFIAVLRDWLARYASATTNPTA